VENSESRLVHENAACASEFHDAAPIAREQKHSVGPLNLLDSLAEAGLGEA
jgi:hypothetical protein